MAADALAPRRVGPVLETGQTANAVIAAIRALNPHTVAIDRGSYTRVECNGRCQVTRASIEGFLQRPFILPGDLEQIMPSFRGRFSVDEVAAVWE